MTTYSQTIHLPLNRTSGAGVAEPSFPVIVPDTAITLLQLADDASERAAYHDRHARLLRRLAQGIIDARVGKLS